METQTNRGPLAGPEALQSGTVWRQIREEFFATGNAAAAASALSRTIDAAVKESYESAIARQFPEAALLACGSFGRGDLFPYSELDLLIVRETEPPPAWRAALATFVELLWVKGLRPNRRVCTVEECLDYREQALDFHINLLDRRLLAGESQVAARLDAGMTEFRARHGQKLSARLAEVTRVRHSKFQNTPCLLQPDVKEAPGGIRDLHLISRLASLTDGAGPDDDVKAAGAFVARIRCFLHYHTAGDFNALDFSAQQALAEQPFAPGGTTPACMREYFKNARVVFREALRALERCEKPGVLTDQHRESQARLSNSEFTVVRERVYLRQPAALAADPGMVFRLLEFVAQHGVPAAVETERRLEAARNEMAAYCTRSQPLWPLLKTLLSHPHASAALQVLRNANLITTILPECANIEGLALPDPDHRFTVDEHTFLTIDCLAGLHAAEEPASQRFADLRAEIDDQSIVLFALLFHETGKGIETDWASKSAALARAAAARFGMSASDLADAEFLIQHQQDLSEILTGRDPDDPATGRWLAGRIATVERLKMLALFTYADVSVTSPNAMTPWRLEQLWQTFQMTQGEFTRQLETDRIVELPAHLSQWGEFIQGFPGRYLRARSAAEIERHTRLYERSRAAQAAVELDRVEGAYRLTVIARDMPGLFASFAGAISSFGLDILKAEAFSNSHGVILDTFVIGDPKRTFERDPEEAERLQDLIRRVALGKTDANRLLRNRAQPGLRKRAFPPQVQFDSEACETATLVEIVTEDRPGLLYSLATAFSSTGCNIDIVLIDTKGHRAIDVFYVAREGRKLTPEFQKTLEEKLLAVC